MRMGVQGDRIDEEFPTCRVDSLANTLLAFLPIAIFLVILFFFFRQQRNSPEANLQKQYVERQIQHTRRVEELLERIAVALEKK